MNKVYEYKSFHSQVKDVDVKEGIVSGYFSNFGTKDSDGDIIKKGAFARTINNNGPASAKPRIKHLLNHNPGQPLGVITQLKEDETGLYYESKVGTHTLGRDFLKMVDSGLVTEHSIGFKTLDEEKKDDHNLIKEVQLWEGSSLTAWGANFNTPIIGMKGQEFDTVNDKVALMEKFIKDSDASDDAIQLMQIQLKQLQQYIIDLRSTTPPAIAPAPEKKEDGLLLTLKQINENFKK